KLREGVRRLDSTLEGILPFLGELFALPGEDAALKKLDPKDKRQKTFEAIRALMVTGSQRRPHVVILEDLHWIDKTSEDCLAFVIESLAGLPMLLLTSYRPGYAARWADKTYSTQIALDLLTREETETMVTAILESHDLPPDLLRIIWEKAEGNSLFIEEVTRSLQEREVLVRRNGGIHWARGGVVELPATIQDIIRARIDRLEEPVKRIVQTASVIGREFGLRLLTRISEMAEEVERSLDTLKHLELIHEKRFFPELEYIFKHAVTQDVAYQSLLLQRRKDLHGAIALAIEDLYADRLDDQATILAYHYARSENQVKAIEYALVAGDRAARLYANAEARTYYEQALTLARALPPSPRRQREEIDATLRLAGVALTREHFEQDLANLEVARALASDLGDQRRTARALYWIARTHYVRGKLKDAVEFAEQSLTVAESLQDDALIVWPVNLLGRIYTVFGDYVNASSMMQRSVELLERQGNQSELATASSILAVALAATGEFQQAIKFSEQGLQIAREIQNLPAEAANYYYRAILYEQKGEWSKLVEDCRAGLLIARRIPDPFRVYVLTCILGYGLFRLGEAQHGIDTIQEGIKLAEQLGTTYLLAWAVSWLSDSYLAQREFDAALTWASRALSLVGQGNDFYGESLASRCYGEALCQKDPSRVAEAEEHIQRAMRLQEEKGMKPQLARSYVGYARLLKVKGEAGKAEECVARARVLFSEMDMQWHLGRLAETFG
ncbi:MAG: tetratricopeptide repeat protein, partial [candidate division NC10 bacterium]